MEPLTLVIHAWADASSLKEVVDVGCDDGPVLWQCVGDVEVCGERGGQIVESLYAFRTIKQFHFQL